MSAYDAAKDLAYNNDILLFSSEKLDPSRPTGLWFCASASAVFAIGNRANAVCMGPRAEWKDLAKITDFFLAFSYVLIVSVHEEERDRLKEELPKWIPGMTILVSAQEAYRGCKSVSETLEALESVHGPNGASWLVSGAEELEVYGLLNLAKVTAPDFAELPKVSSGFPELDKGIGGFILGELSIWTGKRGEGKSTLVSQMLLNAINQGHTVCAYSGELPAEQFRYWIDLQAAGPKHIRRQRDPSTGKQVAYVPDSVCSLISGWMDGHFWINDLDSSNAHDPDQILAIFRQARLQYGADVFLVDNIMSVELKGQRDGEFYRAQSNFVRQLANFAKKHKVHVHLVVHPRKDAPAVAADNVGGSGDITNRADNVFWFSRTWTDDRNGGLTHEPNLVITKNRYFGARGRILLKFDPSSRRYCSKNADADWQYSWDRTGQQVSLQELTGPDPELPFGGGT